MRRYSIELRARKYVKGYSFLSFAKKYKKQLLDIGLDAVRTASKKVIYKAGEFIGKKLQTQLLSQTMIILRNKNLLKKQLFYQKKEM